MTDLPTPLVSTAWLADNLGAPDLVILDCTTVQEETPDGSYAFVPGRASYDDAHIPGAVFCDVLGTLGDKDDPRPLMMPKAGAFKEAMEALGVGDNSAVVVYDRGIGSWAARVWWSLKTYGFDEAAVLDGGFKKWTAEARPVSGEAPEIKPASFTPRYRPERIVSKDEVHKIIEEGGATLVHSLSLKEFTGEAAPMPRAGRIKGSINAPASSLVDPETGVYLSKDKLAAHFDAAGARKSDRVITYCGGGVAACNNALALAVLGFDDIAVYDGSLAEWTADPDAPMETG
ncbi:sulfurtransferase [Hyphococcus luteus]|nr:sulfurtransferase [Marinicaulis flavus]